MKSMQSVQHQGTRVVDPAARVKAPEARSRESSKTQPRAGNQFRTLRLPSSSTAHVWSEPVPKSTAVKSVPKFTVLKPAAISPGYLPFAS